MQKNSTQYLYDCKPADFMDMPYIDAIKYKLKRARELYSQLLDAKEYDNVRMFWVQKAIKHNEKLLAELEEWV